MNAAHSRKKGGVDGLSECYRDSSMRRAVDVMPNGGERANSSGYNVRRRGEDLSARKFKGMVVAAEVVSSRCHER